MYQGIFFLIKRNQQITINQFIDDLSELNRYINLSRSYFESLNKEERLKLLNIQKVMTDKGVFYKFEGKLFPKQH